MDSSTSLVKEIRALRSAVDDAWASDPMFARSKAMNLLARREHTAEELMRKLGKAGFTREAAEAAVAGLARDGLQSDERFVEAFIQSRIGRGKGPVRIRVDLRARGVTDATIDRALAEADADWRALARSVRERKFGRRWPLGFREIGRQKRFLEYRGFEAEHIAAAFDGASGDAPE